MTKLAPVMITLVAIFLPSTVLAQMCSQPPAGLVSWWPGDGNVNDIADGANDGSLVGNVTFTEGLVGEAFKISGLQGDFVRVPANATLEPTNLSLDAWVRADGSPGNFRYLVAKGAQECLVASYALYTGSSGGLLFYVSDGVEFVTSPDAGPGIWDGEWHHVAGTFDGAVVRLFVDAVEIAAGTPTSLAVSYALDTDNDLIVGQYLDGGACVPAVEFGFAGDIDELDLFNVALSESEIQDIYDARNDGKCRELIVAIDIEPGSDDNILQLGSADTVVLAILSSIEFDATQTDPLTVDLAAPAIKLVTDTSAPLSCDEQDINSDGLMDLVCQVNTIDFIIEPGEAVAQLTARTFAGEDIKGQDFIRVVLDPIVAAVDQDSWLKQAARSDNFGNESELPVKRKQGDSERAVIRFDLSGVPIGARVQSAVARLRVTTADRRPVDVYRVTDAWTESGVTWGNTGEDIGANPRGSFTPSRDDSFSSIDLTELVQEWVCGASNNGVMLVATSNDEQSKYYSREIDIQRYRPRLNVEFGVGEATCD